MTTKDKMAVKFKKDYELKESWPSESFSWSMPEIDVNASRLYWMSFVNPNKPPGQQFIGVSIVRVTGQDVIDIAWELLLRFPMHDPVDGPWLAAATRKAHELGINPGGEIAFMRLDGHDFPDMPDYPENVALSHEQLRALGVRQDGSGIDDEEPR